MDAVKSFNGELSALYEIKPPISKAKMTAITKGAIKAIKFYKHVVQSVEKFIQKCRPEYKIPGLYVIDSIVRQSRHQFGADKDVFAPRFARNVQTTFFYLYKCNEDEKSRVIRVLNLWQKNNVFSSEVIQPLFDLANPNSELTKQMEEQVKQSGGKPPKPIPISSASASGPSSSSISVSSGLQISSEFREQQSSSSGMGGASASPIASGGQAAAGGDQQMTQQLQTILSLLKTHVQPNQEPSGGGGVKFNKKLLDFDYSDDEDGPGDMGGEQQPSPAMLEALQGILGNPVVLNKLRSMGVISDHQIQQLQQLLPQAAQQQQQQPQAPAPMSFGGQQLNVPGLGGVFHQGFGQQQQQQQQLMGWGGPPSAPHGMQQRMPGGNSPLEEGERAETDEDIQIVEDRTVGSGWNANRSGRNNDRRSLRRSRSRSRDRKRARRSRSRSRDRGSSRRSSRRSRSRSRDRREREADREKRKEREKKGLPPIRKAFLSVCSTTLWVGHLSKLVAEEDISDLFGEYGDVVKINLIPPRGCAFVCMNRRMDASRCLKQLHRHKLHGKPITLAWAPGKGMKDKQWKDYWDVDLGVSYIPIDKLDPQVNMALLEEGGMFDDDTMPEWMKTMRGVAPTFAQQQQQQQQQQLMGQPPAQAPQPQHPQFIPIPDGLVPPTTAGTVGEIPHPPGLPPFGIPPPGAPPALAGLLAPPHGPAGMLPAAPPPSILLGPPLGPPPAGAPGVLGGPPPGFPPPGFDASQPPPGLRLPGFPPPSAAPAAAGIPPPSALTGAPLGGPPPGNNAIVNASAGNKGESSMDMDVEEEPPQRPKERRNRERQSRWGSKEPASADEGNKGGPPPINTGLPPSNGPPPKHDSNNGPPNSQREGNGPNGSSTLANRLRSLAGFGGQGGPENNDGGGNGSRGPPEMWQQQQNGMDGPPMDRNNGGPLMRRGGPPGRFGPGGPNRNDQDGPPPFMNNRMGPGGPDGPPPFGGDGPPPFGNDGPPPPFGNDGPPFGGNDGPPFGGNDRPPFGGPNNRPPFGNDGPPFGNDGPPFGNEGPPFGNDGPPFGGPGGGPFGGPGGPDGPPFGNDGPPFGSPDGFRGGPRGRGGWRGGRGGRGGFRGDGPPDGVWMNDGGGGPPPQFGNFGPGGPMNDNFDMRGGDNQMPPWERGGRGGGNRGGRGGNRGGRFGGGEGDFDFNDGGPFGGDGGFDREGNNRGFGRNEDRSRSRDRDGNRDGGQGEGNRSGGGDNPRSSRKDRKSRWADNAGGEEAKDEAKPSGEKPATAATTSQSSDETAPAKTSGEADEPTTVEEVAATNSEERGAGKPVAESEPEPAPEEAEAEDSRPPPGALYDGLDEEKEEEASIVPQQSEPQVAATLEEKPVDPMQPAPQLYDDDDPPTQDQAPESAHQEQQQELYQDQDENPPHQRLYEDEDERQDVSAEVPSVSEAQELSPAPAEAASEAAEEGENNEGAAEESPE